MSDFTAQDYRQLSEALEACGGDDAVMPDSYLDSIFDAARRFRDRYQICQTCDGSGGTMESSHTTLGGEYWEPCPDCVGGLVPNQEQQIGWCLEHLSASMKEEGDEDGFDCHVAHLLEALQPCRVVPATVRAFDKEPT